MYLMIARDYTQVDGPDDWPPTWVWAPVHPEEYPEGLAVYEVDDERGGLKLCCHTIADLHSAVCKFADPGSHPDQEEAGYAGCQVQSDPDCEGIGPLVLDPYAIEIDNEVRYIYACDPCHSSVEDDV